MTPELFEPPAGEFRAISDIQREAYYIKYKELGPFQKHPYGMDICVLYRQLVDLKGRYDKIGQSNYVMFLDNIKENVSHDLKGLQLDTEFYLNNFYCVINADNTSYFSYLGLFFALSDVLDLIPKLEYHLEQYNRLKNYEDGSIEYFLGKLEYHVCNYLRSHRFPEDYFVKHESIIRWIYSRKDFYFYQHHFHIKLDALISAINRSLPIPIPDILKEVDDQKVKKRKSVIYVIEGKREILFDNTKVYFDNKSHDMLKAIIAGTANESDMIIFKGQANQLLDVFRIYCEEEFIVSDKRSVAEWVRTHFMFLPETMKRAEAIAKETSEKVIYGQHLPTKSKRIPLDGLKGLRESFYRKEKIVVENPV